MAHGTLPDIRRRPAKRYGLLPRKVRPKAAASKIAIRSSSLIRGLRTMGR